MKTYTTLSMVAAIALWVFSPSVMAEDEIECDGLFLSQSECETLLNNKVAAEQEVQVAREIREDEDSKETPLYGIDGVEGANDTFYGTNAGYGEAGQYNSGFGFNAGNSVSSYYNVFIGFGSGDAGVTGNHNTFIGSYSGTENTTGVQNVFLGSQSGHNNLAGSENVFLGYGSGYNSTESGNIYRFSKWK